MAKILLIETATEVCGAAIAVDGRIIALSEETETTQHAAILTRQIEACVAESGISLQDLDAVAVSRGPGSYTSLRVGTSVAKGICYSLEKPLLAVDTLQALAWASREAVKLTQTEIFEKPHFFVPMIDARRMDVCYSIFDKNLHPITPANCEILSNKMFEKWILESGGKSEASGMVFSGSGSKKAKSVLNLENSVFVKILGCSTSYLRELAEAGFQNSDFQSVAYCEPEYMKPPTITTPRNAYF